jgi:hypothetical protein
VSDTDGSDEADMADGSDRPICGVCNQPVAPDTTIRTTPSGEKCHDGKCHDWSYDRLDVDADPDDVESPPRARVETEPPEPSYLEPEEVAANFRRYAVALRKEKDMVERMADALAHGRLEVSELVDELPDPTPLEAWERDDFEADR